MASARAASKRGPLDAFQRGLVAQRFFIERRTKSQIAAELGITRFRVARLIESSMELGYLRIVISVPSQIDFDLSARLQSAYGLRHALVAAIHDGPPDTLRGALGALAASLMAEILGPHDVLGVAVGDTLGAMAAALPDLPSCTVVQLAGGSPEVDSHADSMNVARRVAEHTGGPVHLLHAPMVVSDPAVAAALKRDPSLVGTFAMYRKLTKAVLGVGAWWKGGSSLHAALPESDRRKLRRAGVVADVCGGTLAADGRILRTGINERLMAISLDELRAVPERIAVAGGTRRAGAIGAALASGLITSLITDADVALELLSAPGVCSPRIDATPEHR